jgi:hypothetical protein
MRGKKSMQKLIALSFNSKFFKAGITLIASLHRVAFDSFDQIIVYDLGLTRTEVDCLNNCEKVKVVSYPEIVYACFDGFLEPRQFAWKPLVIKDVGRKEGELILYIDAGAVVLKDIQIIFTIIDKEEIFLVQDYHLNCDWTTSRALELMNATTEERNGKQLWAGIIGYKVGGKYQPVIDQAFEYAQNQEIVCGDRKCHRHDQSIYSVLAIRYRCPVQPIEIYGQWRGIQSDDQVIYVHRRAFYSKKGLKQKNKKRLFAKFFS